MTRLALWLVARLVPAETRGRWLEEWRAELGHGRRSMILGTLPDAWALRRHGRARRPSGGSPFHGFSQDLRYGLRGLIAAPLFTASVVASLAIGIASTSAAFGFLHSIMFRGFPGVSDQDRLVRLYVNRGCGWPGCWISTSTSEDYEVLRTSIPSLEAVSAEVSTHVAVGVGAEAHSLRAAVVSANYFDVLRVRPALGRTFVPGEQQPAHANVAVIGHSLWQRLFAGDPDVLGRFVDVGGRGVRIVGVAPAKFGGSAKGNMEIGGEYGTGIWLPMPLVPALLQPAAEPARRPLAGTEYRFYYVGRLRAGATLEQALADAPVAGARLQALRGAPGDDTFVQVRGVFANEPAETSLLLAAFMLVPMVVLGIACMNAANLLLARGSERARDLAVRLALGASRWRIIRQVLAESLMLAAAAGALSVPVIRWLLSLGEAATGGPMTLSTPALVFTVAASLLCAFGFGLAPAVRAARSRAGLGASRPGDQAPGKMRGRRVMVAVQVALSLGLLATGGQMIGVVGALFGRTGADDPERLVLASFDLNQLKFTQPAAEDFYRRLLDSVARIPGVENAALARRSALWTWGRGSGASPIIAWTPDEGPKQGALYLGGYAAGDLTGTVGLRVVAGRGFRPEDATPQPSAAIVSRAYAEAKLKGGAVGRTIRVAAQNQGYAKSVEVRIVGVFEAAEDLAYTRRPMQTIYVASRLEREPALTLYVRSRGALQQVAPALRAVVREIDPRVPIMEMETLASLTERRHFEERIMAGGLTFLGTMALVLATAGLYALVSFMVTMRRRELGIRIALGAAPSEILRLILGQSMRLALAGGILGGIVAMVLGAFIHASILGAPRVDATLFAAAALTLVAAMALASAVPARRTARVDPITVLKQE